MIPDNSGYPSARRRISLKTVEGEPLIISASGVTRMVADAKGGTAEVTISDVYQSNGVIMVVNRC